MEIIYRNFISLMSAGAFGNDCHIEPMSRFKWGQTLKLAETYGVAGYVSAGIISAAEQDKTLFPKETIEAAYAVCCSQPTPPTQYDKAFNLSKADTHKFANGLLNRKLRRIVNNEIHSIDTSTTTLTLLFLIIDSINGSINGSINYLSTINLGLYLRDNGDKIDFVKTEQWLRTLGIHRQSNLAGSFLIKLFGFTENEIPFVSKTDSHAATKGLKPLRHTLERASKEPDIRDYEDKMGDRFYIPDTRILGRWRCFPTEVACKFVTGVCRSLSNIEE